MKRTDAGVYRLGSVQSELVRPNHVCSYSAKGKIVRLGGFLSPPNTETIKIMDAVSIGKERKFYNGTGPITRLTVSSSIYRVFLVFESKISLYLMT